AGSHRRRAPGARARSSLFRKRRERSRPRRSPRSASCRGRRRRLRAEAACRWVTRSLDLEDHGIALAAARADRSAAKAAATPAQLEHEAPEDARPGGTDRVPERYGATVDVHPVLVDPEHADRVERDGGERLVD